MLDNYRDLIDELSEGPTSLRSSLADLPQSANPEIAAGVDELRQRDSLVTSRLQTMLKQKNAYLRVASTVTPTAALPPLPELLDAFEHGRGELLSLLMNLTLRDWERTAIDERDGEITVADEVERHVDFNEEQLAKIEAAVEAAS